MERKEKKRGERRGVERKEKKRGERRGVERNVGNSRGEERSEGEGRRSMTRVKREQDRRDKDKWVR